MCFYQMSQNVFNRRGSGIAFFMLCLQFFLVYPNDFKKAAIMFIWRVLAYGNYGSVHVHLVVALVGIISTLRLSICLVDLPNLDKLMSRCRVKMTQIYILSF